MSEELLSKIAHEMSLRPPQEDSLRKFAFTIQPVNFKSLDQRRIKRLLEGAGRTFPNEYARFTFALATGVGKTRLMGAMAAYFFLSERSKHFVILAPSSTIFEKLKAEAQVTHPQPNKYLFAGLTEFPRPRVFHAGNWNSWRSNGRKFEKAPVVFILTPGQIRPTSGKEANRKARNSGDWGPGLVEKLGQLDDLVVFLDEGHRYGQDASAERAWAQAVSDLQPKLVLEMTATPSNEDTVLYAYDLKTALEEGRYIKDVVAIYERRTDIVTDEDWDRHTLKTALAHLETKKSAIVAFCENQPGREKVKPIMLVSCRDTVHAAAVEKWLQSKDCHNGVYRGRVLRVDITQSPEEIARLLEVEKEDNPVEVVVNVGMLKEGWDVKNVFVIVPLRAMLGETLTIQTIGRGLRLPYGERIGDPEVDVLDVMCFGREAVQLVIARAKELGLRFRKKSSSSPKVEQEIKPIKKVAVEVPVIDPSYSKSPSLRGLHLSKPKVILKGLRGAETKKIKLRTGETSTIGEALHLGASNIPRLLGQLLVKEMPEFGGEEDLAERLFQQYFKAAGVGKVERQRIAAQVYGREILDDVIRQVGEYLAGIKPIYKSVEEERKSFAFGPITYSIPKEEGILAQNAVKGLDDLPDSSCLVGGWKNSIYPAYRFDSDPELTAARIIDATIDCVWTKNPDHWGEKGFYINTLAGKHYPDFVVLLEGGVLLLEIKDHGKLRVKNSEALRKAQAASIWCVRASKLSKKKWHYAVIADDRVSACANIGELVKAAFPVQPEK